MSKKKFIIFEEIELTHSLNMFNPIASTDDFVQAGELARAKKIAKDLELQTKAKVKDYYVNDYSYIIVERCDLSTLKE